MGKKGRKTRKNRGHDATVAAGDSVGAPQKRLDGKTYDRELERLQGELVKLQFWAKQTGARIVVLFEGRDAAGKGGVIKRITERVSPRVFRLVALPAPTEREKSQMFHPALPPAHAGRRRNRDLRPQLVQPCRRRARDGVLQRSGVPALPEALSADRALHCRFRDPAHQVLVRGQHGGADAPVRGTHDRCPQALEAEPDGPRIAPALVRFFACPRRHARRDRHRLQSLVRRPGRRQAPRPA